MIQRKTQSSSYWDENFSVEDSDIEYLNNLLLEDETPLTTNELVSALIRNRVTREQRAIEMQLTHGSAAYLPKETYTVGQTLSFPQIDFAAGNVTAVRAGQNPDLGSFDVITVDFGERGTREFAARLATHKLNANEGKLGDADAVAQTPEHILEHHGQAIAAKLAATLKVKGDIVPIAGHWFSHALLADINEGHLNLAEAALDMAGGGPLGTPDLLTHLDLPATINDRLKIFSLDYALQEDERFDEVGPAGQVLWYLHRLEPQEVLNTPPTLKVEAADESIKLSAELRKLEADIDDEFGSPHEHGDALRSAADGEVTLYLTFPHRRAGTLPLSEKVKRIFPTAYESPRVRFTLIDGHSGEKHPGWVVREGRYVFGLEEWYKKYEMPVGGTIRVKQGDAPEEVVVKIARRKLTREWLRTAAIADGKISFAMQKRPITTDYDELMIVSLDNFNVFDEAWKKMERQPFAKIVADVFRELAKLTTQSAVHARSLYSAVNVIRRAPPAPIFHELISRPYFVHVGDAYWRFDESKYSEQ